MKKGRRKPKPRYRQPSQSEAGFRILKLEIESLLARVSRLEELEMERSGLYGEREEEAALRARRQVNNRRLLQLNPGLAM